MGLTKFLLSRVHNVHFKEVNFAKQLERLYCTHSSSKVISDANNSSALNWSIPEGYCTGIQVYHPVLREKVPLILKNKNIATWYTCGPTVYSEAHIGHASCYVKFDVIRRILQNIFDVDVTFMMGITDIDDKIIHRAKKECVSVQHISKKYEEAFFNDMDSLNVQRPTVVARVTEFIPQIIHFCKTLIEKEYAYVTEEGNVYFIVSKVDSSEVVEGAQNSEFQHSLIDPLKKDQRDFALWKKAKPKEPYWSSPWGDGRPGWHIECSAMASEIFGSNMDIHSGGADLIFPHHANERSQSESYHNCKQWVNYWFHAGLLHISGSDKMSKSIGNTISIRDFLCKHSANVFRIMCLQSLYRNSIEYSPESLQLAQNTYNKFQLFINDAELYTTDQTLCQPIDKHELHIKFTKSQESISRLLANDFNTNQVLKNLIDLITEVNQKIEVASENHDRTYLAVVSAVGSYIDKTLEILGVTLVCKKKLPVAFTSFVDVIIELRGIVRNYALKKYLSNGNHENEKEVMLEDIDKLKRKLLSMEYHTKSENFCRYGNLNYFCDGKGLTETVLQFCNNIEQLSIKDGRSWTTEQTGETLTIKEYNKLEKERKAPFIRACDGLRLDLYSFGITVKDIKMASSWYPVEIIWNSKCNDKR